MRNPGLAVALLIVNAPIAYGMLRFTFSEWQELGGAIAYIAAPWWAPESAFFDADRYSRSDMQWAIVKLVALSALIGGMLASEYHVVVVHVPAIAAIFGPP